MKTRLAQGFEPLVTLSGTQLLELQPLVVRKPLGPIFSQNSVQGFLKKGKDVNNRVNLRFKARFASKQLIWGLKKSYW